MKATSLSAIYGIANNPILSDVYRISGCLVISQNISERPVSAENRSPYGYRKCDTVAGKRGKAGLITLVHKKGWYLLGGKAARKRAQAINTVIMESQLHCSLMPDKEKEFANHTVVTETLGGVSFYFPPPHQP